MKLPHIALGLLAALFVAQDARDTRPAPPEIGKAAPAFRLNDHEGRSASVGGESTNWTVVAFYPKAMTPG